MSRHDRRHHEPEPGDGPLDPYTGLPGSRPNPSTPIGQIQQAGLMADGVRRLRDGRTTGWRHLVVPLGLLLVVGAGVLAVVLGLGHRSGEPAPSGSAATTVVTTTDAVSFAACQASSDATTEGIGPDAVTVHRTTGSTVDALQVFTVAGTSTPVRFPADDDVLVAVVQGTDGTGQQRQLLAAFHPDGTAWTTDGDLPVEQPVDPPADVSTLGPGTAASPVVGDVVCLAPS